MAGSPRIPVRVDIESAIRGARNIQALTEELRALRAEGSRPVRDPTVPLREGASRTGDAFAALQRQVAGFLSAGLLVRGVRAAVREFQALESAILGLESVAEDVGAGVGNAFEEASKIAANGVLSIADASQALQRLLATGFGLQESVDIINRLSDAAAFNRQATLGWAEAIVSATDGIKNQNNQLIDNAGITKNVGDIVAEYAAELGKTTAELTEAERLTALYNGIMEETEAQVGNTAKAMETAQGEFARARNEARQFAALLGEVLTPVLADVAAFGQRVLTDFVSPAIPFFKTAAVSVASFFDALSTGIASIVRGDDIDEFGQKMADIRAAWEATVEDIARNAPVPGGRGRAAITAGLVPGDEDPERIAQVQAELARETARARAKRIKDEERAAAAAKRAADKRSREAERAQAKRIRDAEREAAEVLRIERALAGARFELARATGAETEEIRRAAIAAQFDDLRRDLEERGDAAGIALIDSLINVQAAEARFSALEETLNRGLARIRDEQATIAAQRAAGTLGEAEAAERILELRREGAELIRATLPDLERAAEALGPDAAADVARWRQELERASIVVNETARRFTGEFRDAVADFFVAIGDGSKSAAEAFRDFARTVLSSIQRILAQKFAEKLTGGLGGLLGGGGGGAARGPLGGGGGSPLSFLQAILGQFLRFSEGGAVSGPGGPTSDSIPARLSAGEYVLSAAAVGRIGVGVLDAINGLGRPSFGSTPLRFADGGEVPAAAPAAAAPGIRIVNVMDPEIAGEYLESSSGEQTIMNVLRRNSGTLRQLVS